MKTSLSLTCFGACLLLGAAAAPGRGVNLLQVYPTSLTAGDPNPEQARAWNVTAGDIYRLSRFEIKIGSGLKVEMGVADLGVGHCQDGAVWAVVVPRGSGTLTSSGTPSPEKIAHVWLRFHPKEITRLFPEETVSEGGASDLLPGLRTVAQNKMNSSWQAGGRAMIPGPKDMTVDVDIQGGPRRFFVVDTAAQTAEYVDAFADQPVPLQRGAVASESAGDQLSLEKAPPVVIKTIPPAGATDVDPGLKELRVTFSKKMQDGSWSWTTLSGDTFPDIVGKIHYLADGRTCVAPVKLEAGKFYATWLNSESFHNFRDTQGQPAIPYLFSFKTANRSSGPADKSAGPVPAPRPQQ